MKTIGDILNYAVAGIFIAFVVIMAFAVIGGQLP